MVVENIVDQDVLEPLDLSSGESDDDASNKKHATLLDDLTALGDTGKRKKKIVKRTRIEPSKEISEFTWNTSGQEKLALHELVAPLKGTTQSIADIKKRLSKLEKSSKTLDVPLPKPQAERIERTVAYQATSKDISKWAPTIRKNRDAEQLVFPLQEFKPPAITTKSMVANFKPQNAMEMEIAAVLKGSKPLLERKDKELTQAEEEALKSFDLEEAMERRAQLQKARALQSYYEAKCRRIKKIKSKKYHRVLKKEEKKVLDKIDVSVLAKEDPELFKSELAKAEKMRALERANLRHRNTSKWAKNLITRGQKSKEDQDNLREQLRVSRQLTEHKVLAQSDEEEMEDVLVVKDDEDQAKQLHLLSSSGGSSDNPWLLGQNDQEVKDKLENAAPLHLKKLQPVQNEDVDELQDEGVGGDEKLSSGEEWEADDETSTQLDVVNSSAEKIKSKKKKKKKIKNVADNLDNESDLISEKNVKRKKGKIKKKKIVDDTESVVEEATFNDTNLEVTGDNTAVNYANLKPTPGIDSIEDDKTNLDARPILESAESANQQDSLDANIESLESDQEYEGVAKPTEAVKKVKKKKKKNTAEDSSLKKKKKSKKERKMEEMNNITKSDKEVCEVIVNNEDEDMNQDDDASDSEHLMNIREAFANDDVVGDFVNEKDELLESAKPVDLTLPGWGEWTGPGMKVSSRKRKKFTKEEKDKPARKDAKLSHVIINEDRNKKMAKIKVSNVPFPYTSKAEFERSIRQPIGPHWNTPSVVNKLTEPRIKVRAGHVIKPLHATKGQKKAWKSNQDNKEKRTKT